MRSPSLFSKQDIDHARMVYTKGTVVHRRAPADLLWRPPFLGGSFSRFCHGRTIRQKPWNALAQAGDPWGLRGRFAPHGTFGKASDERSVFLAGRALRERGGVVSGWLGLMGRGAWPWAPSWQAIGGV